MNPPNKEAYLVWLRLLPGSSGVEKAKKWQPR